MYNDVHSDAGGDYAYLNSMPLTFSVSIESVTAPAKLISSSFFCRR